MVTIKLENPPKTQEINKAISRRFVIDIINKIGCYDKNVFLDLQKNIGPKYDKYNIYLDGMDSCDPGIKISSLRDGFKDYVLWWEDDNVEFVVIIDGEESWNSTNVCYVRNKHTNKVDRSLIIDSISSYIKMDMEESIKGVDFAAFLQECTGQVIELEHYCDVRPIIADGLGEDLEDYPNPEVWIGWYYDKAHLNWFINNIFNNGLANIAVIL